MEAIAIFEEIEDKGNFDNRRETAGHVGKADADAEGIVLKRAFCSPRWGANEERFTIVPVENGVRVSLVPESDGGPWVKGRIYKGLDFELVAIWLGGLDQAEFDQGPTHIYSLFLDRFGEA